MIDDSREKLINMIIFFLKNTKYCGKTKLFKLLNFADFKQFQQTGNSISDLIYYTYPWGPVPEDLFNEFKHPPRDLEENFYIPQKEEFESEDDNEFFDLKPKRKFNDKCFSDEEIEVMEQIAYIYKEVKSKDISKISHNEELPWHKTREKKGLWQAIDYFLALNENSPPRSTIETIHAERFELKKMLS